MHVGMSGGAAAANRARELGGYSCIMLAIAAGFEGQPRSEATPARSSWPADVQRPTLADTLAQWLLGTCDSH